MTRLLMCVLFASALCLTAGAQPNQRFPAPLGLDRILTGTISKAKTGDQTQKNPRKRAKYILSNEGQSYLLHGHEAELKKLIGKRVRIIGNAVGDDVTVNSVAPVEQ